MKNLAEELEFGEVNTGIEVKPLILIEKEKKVSKENKSILKRLWKIVYAILKRTVDIMAGLVGTLVAIPIMFFVKIAYLINGDNAPILFKQKRIGKKRKRNRDIQNSFYGCRC